MESSFTSSMSAPDLGRLFNELVRFQIELWNGVDARLRADHDLPLSRFEPMQIIARRGSCRVNDIAEEMVITVGGTSKLIDRIEGAGFCRRRSNPDDRRSSLIELTPTGELMLAQASSTYEEELRNRLGGALPASVLEQLSASLTTLRSAGHHLTTIDRIKR